MPALDFGIFDWLDANGQGLADEYEQRLRMLEYADRAGYFAYHLAEHHGTLLSTAPSPNLFFSLVAQRTSRLRFGPMVYLLPMYHPVRLIEEICMLDQLSKGRLELGLGRPVSPWEAALYGVDMGSARSVAHEVIEVLLQGMAAGVINYDGQHLHIRDVRLTLRPYQQPYPSLWYPTNNLSSIPWIAENNFSVMLSFWSGGVTGSSDPVHAKVQLYQQLLAESAARQNRINAHIANPKCGIEIQLYVAETDADARRVANEAHAAFYQNFTSLRHESNAPVPESRRAGEAFLAQAADFDTFVEQGWLIYGSPQTVRARLQECLDQTGANYVAGVFAWGNLKHEQVMRSLDLFTTEVKPQLAARAALAQPVAS